MYEYVTTNTMLIIGTLGMLAFIVNVIVELTKEFFPKIPTKLYVLIISQLVTVCNLVYASTGGVDIKEVITTLISAFMVAHLSIFGWETFTELWDRFRKGDEK